MLRTFPWPSKELAALLQGVFPLHEVSVAALLDMTDKYVYAEFTSTLSPPQGKGLPGALPGHSLPAPPYQQLMPMSCSPFSKISSLCRFTTTFFDWLYHRAALSVLGCWWTWFTSSPHIPESLPPGLSWRCESPC
jgi:hypothetical protein